MCAEPRRSNENLRRRSKVRLAFAAMAGYGLPWQHRVVKGPVPSKTTSRHKNALRMYRACCAICPSHKATVFSLRLSLLTDEAIISRLLVQINDEVY